MYWFKSRFPFVIAGGILLFFSACHPDVAESGDDLKYFDIKGYFTKDIARLSKLNRPVFKTVSHNGVTESKKMFIHDWDVELNLFKSSDINRPAWKNSYIVKGDTSVIIYVAKEADLYTREIIINRVKGKVKWIMIANHSPNMLYNTREKLSYFPDSLYLIQKAQSVRFLGTNKYQVKGLLK